MTKRVKHIVALLIIIVPFYVFAIVQKILFSQSELFAEQFFAIYMTLSVIGISTVLITNRYLLGNSLKMFTHPGRKTIIDIALALMLMAALYFVKSLESSTYARFFTVEIDRTAILELLNTIFSNVVYSIIIVGPFTWLNEIFAVLSLAFILNCLWAISPNKKWMLGGVFLAALLFSLLQISNGIPAIISSFILVSLSNYIYLRYRSIFPLLIALVLIQTIDLLSFWVYS